MLPVLGRSFSGRQATVCPTFVARLEAVLRVVVYRVSRPTLPRRKDGR